MRTDISFAGKCTVDVEFRLPGASESTVRSAIIDTGFFHESWGLGLPRREAAKVRGTPVLVGRITLGHGRKVPVRFCVDVQILRIGSIVFDTPWVTETMFIGKERVYLGMGLLRKGSLFIDGPNATGHFTVG